MDIFAIAIKMEQEGAAFYHDLADQAQAEGLKTIFSMLSEDEKKHERTFAELKRNSVPVMVPSKAKDSARSIFKQFKKEDLGKETEQLKLYGQALEVETKSIEFYSAQMEHLKTADTKEAVQKIIEEEKSHYEMISELIKLVNRPNEWVENAEFGVREDY
jgi:rubrerythrin